jgi:ABC-type sugar transport system ATPase subunit
VRVEGRDAPSGLARVRFGEAQLSVSTDSDPRTDGVYHVCVRPHDIRFANGSPSENRLSATVTTVQWQGDHHAITLHSHGTPLRIVVAPLREPPAPGAVMDVGFAPADAMLIAEELAS